MYIMVTFTLIILIPTFLGLLFTTNIKKNMKPIAIVGLGITIILGYMYIPTRLPVSKRFIDSSLVYYDGHGADKYYQEQFVLIPKDQDRFVSLLNQQKYYNLMDDRQYYFSKSKQFELFDLDFRSHYRLNINAHTFSTLSKSKKNYRFQASPELLQLVDQLSKVYEPVSYDNTDIESLSINLIPKTSNDHTYFFDVDISTNNKDTLITEINLYYEYNYNESSLSYLLDESPIENFKDTIEVSMLRGKDAYLKEAKDCQLIIRGQHKVEGEIVPFQKLIDLDEIIIGKEIAVD